MRQPGMVPLTDRMTALEAVMAAGGYLNESAKPENVVLVRHANGKREAMLLDLTKPLENSESGQVFLRPLDIVFVPRTRISKVNQWVRQYINNMIPGLGGIRAIAGP